MNIKYRYRHILKSLLGLGDVRCFQRILKKYFFYYDYNLSMLYTVVYVRKKVNLSLYSNLEDVGNEIYFKCTLK